MSLPWVCPGFPNYAQLHDHIGWGEDKLGQCDEPFEQGSGLGLGSGGHARNGAFADQGSHGEGVDAEPENPGLGALVIGRWGGI